MTAPHRVDAHGLLGEALAEASPDLMCTLLQRIINDPLSADAAARSRSSPLMRSRGKSVNVGG